MEMYNMGKLQKELRKMCIYIPKSSNSKQNSKEKRSSITTRPISVKTCNHLDLNRRIRNRTYGGVRGQKFYTNLKFLPTRFI